MKAFLVSIIAFITAISNLFSSTALKAEFKAKGNIIGYSQTVSANKELRDFTVDENGDFTVLQFSDTHFTSFISFSDIYLLNKMKENVKKYSPDLVVVSGDMVDDGNRGTFNKAYVLRTVAQMFEDLGQYWAYVPGNNDGINYGTSADVVAYLSKYEHCLVADEKDISGAAQYSIDIYDGKELVHSFVFIDTMDYDNEDPNHMYGYVHEDQVEWVRKQIAKKKLQNRSVKVSMFMHENTPNFAKAGKSGSAYGNGFGDIRLLGESFDIPKNQPLDDVVKQSGCVGLLSIGHVHPLKPMCDFYDGVYYHIAQQAINSSTLITVHTDENNVQDMYEFKVVL